MAKSTIYTKLAAQVQWQHPKMRQGHIDQTRLSIADAPSGAVPFSFMVMGDTDAGLPSLASDAASSSFSKVFAEQMIPEMAQSRFLLHTGDVTYPIGSYENYWAGFLRPYQALLSSLPTSPCYGSESVVFKRPLLPVPGNHDYAGAASVLHSLLRVMCDRLRSLGIDLGHYGGQGGEAYGQTFLDDLQQLSAEQLTAHLATHYSALVSHPMMTQQTNGIAFDSSSSHDFSRCLNYRPGQFTRLPNRYYSFRYGGVDFFALDSNSWNTSPNAPGFDQQQLDWLEQALVKSWQTPNTVGRIVYLHHSPYTTEATRWQQSETLWVRRHLRAVLNRVAETITMKSETSGLDSNFTNRPMNRPVSCLMNRRTSRSSQAPWVDMVVSGHAHCLEHLQTTDTGHADAGINWVVCGGSGAGLRRQREAGPDILENLSRGGKSHTQVVAQSKLYAAIQGQAHKKQLFHSFLRIEVQPHQLQKFLLRPFVVTQQPEGFQTRALKPIRIGSMAGSMLGSMAGSVAGSMTTELLDVTKENTALKTYS
jgi:3',5'-cyclic AMP phosphodiesterase CpdA